MTISQRRVLTVAGLAAALWCSAGRAPLAQPAPVTHLVIVVDGLRPDYVTPEVMPRLSRLAQRGTTFTAHHAVYPTVTRVNASSFVTGSYPETHGLLGNTVYIPGVDAAKGLDTGNRANLEAVARAEGQLLTAPSLGTILKDAGKTLMVSSSGSSGSAFLLNHVAGTGPSTHIDGQAEQAVDVYLDDAAGGRAANVTFIWLNNPDATAHARGIGAEPTRLVLTQMDANVGRIEDTLRAAGRLDRTNILVTSDHGFSTHTGTLRLAEIVEPFARPMPDGTKDIAIAEGAIYLRSGADAARLAAIVAELQRRPEVGAIFTRTGVPGTLPFEVARWNHARAGDILVSANWNDEANAAGYKGKTTQGGVAGHGTSSPYDIHNTLIAAGPDFRAGATSSVPTGNVDIAPTLLQLMGLPLPPTMSGRVIGEGLRNGPAPASVGVERTRETAKTPDGSYELTAHISIVSGRRYLDFTEVTRR